MSRLVVTTRAIIIWLIVTYRHSNAQHNEYEQNDSRRTFQLAPIGSCLIVKCFVVPELICKISHRPRYPFVKRKYLHILRLFRYQNIVWFQRLVYHSSIKHSFDEVFERVRLGHIIFIHTTKIRSKFSNIKIW